jgi:hypothetical protein
MNFFRLLVALYILTSFITRPIFAEGTFLGRFVLADFFGLAALFVFLIYHRQFSSNHSFKSFWWLLLCFFIGITASEFPMTSFGEIVILSFLLLLSQAIFTIYKEGSDAINLFILLSWVNLLASLIGIYDSYFAIGGLPRIFPARADGEALSGFKNAGQAGAYIQITLFCCYAFFRTKLFDKLSLFQKNQFRISLIISFLFFVLTGKIAAYIGTGVGILLYLLLKRKLSSFLTVSLLFLSLIYLFNKLPELAPQINKRIFAKVRTRVLEPMDMTDTKGKVDGTSFLNRNFQGALQAFDDNPLAGSGIGGFLGRYDRHEVHSTYMKIIGETGLLGIVSYCFFMISLLRMLFYFQEIPDEEEEQHAWFAFLMELRPFVIGWLVSWAYTYHLRKREFWLAFALISIAYFLAKRSKSASHNPVL